MRHLRILPLLAMTLIGTGLLGCATEPKTAEGKANLHDEVTTGLNSFERADPSLHDFMNRGAGYAMFPSVGKGGVIAGGAYGRGEVYEGSRLLGYSDLTQATIGLQLGGQTFSELIVFENRDSLDRFKAGKFSFSANASAVALKSGAAASANFKDGIAVFTKPKGGLMFEASIGGQEFSFMSVGAAERAETTRDEHDAARATVRVEKQ